MKYLVPVNLGFCLLLLAPLRNAPAQSASTSATSAESLAVPSGFKVELLHSALKSEGSWICMAFDGKNRLIISPQADSQPLLRLSFAPDGKVAQVEPIAAPVHQAMGLLWAYDSLYVNGHGPDGTGLYRLIDGNHNDNFETNEVHFLKKFAGEGEHGYHALGLGPDKMIYVMNGNHTRLPEGLSPNSPHKNFQEDFLLPRQWDANGHAVGIMAPGGHVLRTDAEGKTWQLMLAGFRNAYDFDFNEQGELFTFDSDMEWDWGLPWYRPTRIIHCVQGGEYGWRSGSSKWPDYYCDSLPPASNIGLGSPTGVRFGTKSHFPPRYRKALYAMDWSYGRIFAVHLQPNGASYTGEYEVFVKGKPLNVTHIEFGRDGAMYFITGGRGTQSGLYRVSYPGKIQNESVSSEEKSRERAGLESRALRHRLESFQGKKDPHAVDVVWPHLNSEDPFIRDAARIALEWQEVDLWQKRALAETHPNASLAALLALARCGDKQSQPDLLHALDRLSFDSLSLTQKLARLRVTELSFIRQGKPSSELAQEVVNRLNPLYPANNEFLNRELSQLLIYLEAPEVVGKTLKLLDAARTQEEQAHYVFHLRTLQSGWTLEQRKHYFDWFHFAQEANRGEVTYTPDSPYYVWAHQEKASERHPAELLRWFKEAGRDYGDGASYGKYLINIRNDAIATLSEQDRIALSSWIVDYSSIASFKPSKERGFVKEWKMPDLESKLERVAYGRNFNNGKTAFNDAKCSLCHRTANQGGSVGPELGAVASKYSRREILESIVDPSKVVSEQYQNYVIIKRSGESESGRIVDEDSDQILLQVNLLEPQRLAIKKKDIAERKPSKVSPMPEGLLNQFTEEEILDLLAYLESGGKSKANNFEPAKSAAR